MARRYILGCDIGTTSTKLVLLDHKGEVCASTRQNLETRFPHPGWAEQDASQYWESFSACARQAMDRLGILDGDLEAVGLSGMAPNCILVDEQINPLKPGIIWMDNRATEESAWLTGRVGEEKAWQVSANPIHPYYGLPKLLWEQRHNRELYEKAHKVLSAKDFILGRLTGETVTDYSSAALYAPAFDIRLKEWNEEVLQSSDIAKEKLPAVLACEEVAGKISQQGASQCGLQAGIPVIAGTVDTGADAAACGVIEPGSSFLTTGTAFCLGTVLDRPRFVRGLMAFPHTVQSSTHYVTTGVVTSGGALMSWLGGILGGSEMELLARLDQEAEAIPAGSEGLLVLPYFMGERAPIWDPLARGVFFGLSLKHGRGHLARALMEAVAYGLNTILELGREAGIQYNGSLFLIGGGASSRVWNQIIASVTGLQTVEVTNPLGSAVGAAMAAGLGTGFFASPADVTRHLKLGTICIPNRRDTQVYHKGYKLYKQLYQDLKPRFADAAAGDGGFQGA